MFWQNHWPDSVTALQEEPASAEINFHCNQVSVMLHKVSHDSENEMKLIHPEGP